MKLRNSIAALLAVGMLLSGCEVDHPSSTSDNATTPQVTATVPLFEPLAQDSSKIPFPVDLLFSGSLDGSLNIPGVVNSNPSGIPSPAPEQSPTAAQLADPMVALNTSSGFSTTAMLTIPFSGPVLDNQDNFAAGIRIFKTNGSFPLGTMSGVTDELTYGVDFVASVSGNTVAIVPLRPLTSATSYVVVVTTNLKGSDGKPVAADAQYADARSGKLGPLPDLTTKTQAQEGLVAAYSSSNPFPPTILKGSPTPVPLNPGATGNIALSYTVTTQNLNAALAQAQVVVGSSAAGATPADIKVAKLTSQSGMDIYGGELAGVDSFLDPNDPVHSIWNNAGNNLSGVNSFIPDVSGTTNVPILVTVPSAATQSALSCPANMPVVIYQHGITRNRGDLLAIAPDLTKKCTVGVAIDMPEHGIKQSATLGPIPLGQLAAGADQVFNVKERLVTKGAFGPAPDGCLKGAGSEVTAASGATTCSAGDSYINLTNLANSRDVLRQSVIDLDSLYLALTTQGILATVDVTNPASPAPIGASLSIDPTSVAFVGQSLGSIVGETFVATLDTLGGSLTSAVFNVGGGGIAKLLDGSPSIEPTVLAGLAPQGVTKPSGQYESFLIAAQTMVDSADPINYTGKLATMTDLANGGTTPILFQEVVGDGSATNPPDDTVPNNVFGTAFAPAWNAVSGSLQTGWLAGQNTQTVPAALGGADSLVQGTSFLSLAQAMADPAAQACAQAYGALCPAISQATGGVITPFTGIGLPEVSSDGKVTAPVGTPAVPTQIPAQYGVVRFTKGEHGSLLSPSAPAVNELMKKQVADFVSGNGVDGESACTTNSCTGIIASW